MTKACGFIMSTGRGGSVACRVLHDVDGDGEHADPGVDGEEVALREQPLEGDHEGQAQDDAGAHQRLQSHMEVLDGAAQGTAMSEVSWRTLLSKRTNNKGSSLHKLSGRAHLLCLKGTRGAR